VQKLELSFTFDLDGRLRSMEEDSLKGVWVVLLPFALFVALYFSCRKENQAIEILDRYRMAVCASFTFLMWVLVQPYGGRGAARILADLSGTASVACAWGLAVTALRLGVKKPVAAIILTLFTTVSLGWWGVIWANQF
jgi:hypothetical protein